MIQPDSPPQSMTCSQEAMNSWMRGVPNVAKTPDLEASTADGCSLFCVSVYIQSEGTQDPRCFAVI